MKKLIALILSLCLLMGMLPAVAETKTAAKADLHELLVELLSDTIEGVIKIPLSNISGQGRGKREGSMNSFFAKVLNAMSSARAESGEEADATLENALAALSSIHETEEIDEDAIEGTYALLLVSLLAQGESEEHHHENDARWIGTIMQLFYETLQENETIAEAVKATDSKLFEQLTTSFGMIHALVNEDQTIDMQENVNEEYFDAFEDEIEKLIKYLDNGEGPAKGAQGMLRLLDEFIDDIHDALDSHHDDD